MAGLLDFGTEEDKKQGLGLLGLLMGSGILAGNQPGASVGQAFGQGTAQGVQGLMQMKQQQAGQQLRDLQMQKLKADMAKEQGQQSAQAALFGGQDGQGINWNTPRPMNEQQRMGMMGQAFPTQYGTAMMESLFPKPTDKWVDAGGGLQKNERTGETKPISPKLVDVNVQAPKPPVLQSEEDKALGQQYVAEYKGVVESASAAENARNQIRMARAYSDTSADGKELPSVLQQKVGNAAVALGFDVESPTFKSTLGRVSDGQSFVGTMQNLVLTKMQAQKGPQTENDAKRIEATLANLGNTPEARDFLLRASDALAYEDIQKRDFYESHRGEKGTLAGANMNWRAFRNQVPFMGVSPNTGKPVFFAEFADANRGKPQSALIEAWKKQYGN